MLSQLTKTIKMALKSTEEERAILRARSALQRFPVVEWRQRMEDFHKRSITASRNVAGVNAWRESDCDGASPQRMADAEDWSPVDQPQPTQPDWDAKSARSFSDSPNTPSSPAQWSRDSLANAGADPESARSIASPGGYSTFLERANKTIAKDQGNAPDPFLDPGLSPAKPFGIHSRVSSVESISTIVEEKSNSPLNKAIASVSRLSGHPHCG